MEPQCPVADGEFNRSSVHQKRTICACQYVRSLGDVAAIRGFVPKIVSVMSRFEHVKTARLLMRRRRDSDRAPFADLNADQK